MTRRPHLLVFCVVSVVSITAWAGQSRPAAPEAEKGSGVVSSRPGNDPREFILAREMQRVGYLISVPACPEGSTDCFAGVYDGLAKMTSATLSYSHSNGNLDGKDAWLTSLRSGQVKFSKLAHRDVQVRFLRPDVAVLNGLSDVEVAIGGQLQRMSLRFTIVYVAKDGEWLFEAWHSSRRPD